MSYEDNPMMGKKGMTVRVFNSNIDAAIVQLKRRVNAEGINKELRRRQEFQKPSVVRRRKLAEAIMRWRKKEDLINEIERPKKKKKNQVQRPHVNFQNLNI